MTKKGATIYLSWSEYSAICQASDNLATQLESSNEDYVKSTEPIIGELSNIKTKFKNAKNKSFRAMVIDELIKDGKSKQEAIEMYRKYKGLPKTLTE